MLPFVFVFSTLILIIVILLYNKQEKNLLTRRYDNEELKGRPCPICHWPLRPNERVHSHLFRKGEDSIMHIFGCPYCYKDHPKSKYIKDSHRTCPACNKRVNDGEFIIARLFEKPGKNHVHVLGCYRCRGKR